MFFGQIKSQKMEEQHSLSYINQNDQYHKQIRNLLFMTGWMMMVCVSMFMHALHGSHVLVNSRIILYVLNEDI